MSAEKEALVYLNQIFAEIKDTLEDAKNNKRDAKQLSNEENASLNNILTNIKRVRSKLNTYLQSFRVQTSLTDFNTDTNED
tara:strand:- start:407 stop:649 length:243 start_codon:yes stop_codon:yes gene_type:complete